jgi:hypothetical protein
MINFIKRLLGCGNKKNEIHIYLHVDNNMGNMGNMIDLDKYIKPAVEPNRAEADIKQGLGDVKIPEVEFGDPVNE